MLKKSLVYFQGAPGATGLVGAQGVNGTDVSDQCLLNSYYSAVCWLNKRKLLRNGFALVFQGDVGPAGAVGRKGPQVYSQCLVIIS